jgi:HSP20 family protein
MHGLDARQTGKAKEVVMANITRYTPFGDLMDEMFKNFMSRPMRYLEQETGMQMRVDVSEDDKNFAIKAEIPGVKKEDIHVTIDGNRVSISAESRQESEEKEGAKVIRSERYYGKVYRSMTLDSDVDQNAAEAKYADGVLTLTLPKKPGGTTRQLTVN